MAHSTFHAGLYKSTFSSNLTAFAALHTAETEFPKQCETPTRLQGTLLNVLNDRHPDSAH